MTSQSKIRRLFVSLLTAGILFVTASLAAQDTPLCSGSSDKSATGTTPSTTSVTLNWIASVPASSAPKDAIKGYYIYRSLEPNSFDENKRLNSTPLQGTRCIDPSVDSKKTYYYVVTSVSNAGVTSGYSNQTSVDLQHSNKP